MQPLRKFTTLLTALAASVSLTTALAGKTSFTELPVLNQCNGETALIDGFTQSKESTDILPDGTEVFAFDDRSHGKGTGDSGNKYNFSSVLGGSETLTPDGIFTAEASETILLKGQGSVPDMSLTRTSLFVIDTNTSEVLVDEFTETYDCN